MTSPTTQFLKFNCLKAVTTNSINDICLIAPDGKMSESTMSSQVIFAPARPTITGKTTIFLAGTTSPTSEADWRETLSRSLSSLPITIFNPFRADWDHTWQEDISDPKFKEQVEWELDMQEAADLMVIYFHPITLAPISLLELGLCARSGKVIVVCPGGPNGYKKRGNVQVVCERFGLTLVGTAKELEEEVKKRLST